MPAISSEPRQWNAASSRNKSTPEPLLDEWAASRAGSHAGVRSPSETVRPTYATPSGAHDGRAGAVGNHRYAAVLCRRGLGRPSLSPQPAALRDRLGQVDLPERWQGRRYLEQHDRTRWRRLHGLE